MTTTEALPESIGYVYSVAGEYFKNAALDKNTLNGTQLYTAAQLADYAARVSAAKDAELDRLNTLVLSWLRANGPGGWINDLRTALEERDAEIGKLRALVGEYLQTAQELVDESISLRAAAQQALEALEEAEPMLAAMLKNIVDHLPQYGKMPALDSVRSSITALKAALKGTTP